MLNKKERERERDKDTTKKKVELKKVSEIELGHRKKPPRKKTRLTKTPYSHPPLSPFFSSLLKKKKKNPQHPFLMHLPDALRPTFPTPPEIPLKTTNFPH